VIGSRKSKKEIQYTAYKKRDKKTNNDLQRKLKLRNKNLTKTGDGYHLLKCTCSYKPFAYD
jgi:hypothetical protein